MGYANVIETLRDPEVKNYFLGILRSRLPDEEKLEKFVEFFDLQGRLEEKMAGLVGGPDRLERSVEGVSAAAQQIGVWQPERILERTESSVRRGVGRILRCQHRDGGWGYEPETSNLWGTAHSVTALRVASDLGVSNTEVNDPMRRGIAWIERWFADQELRPHRSTYDAALAVRCLHRLGQPDFPPATTCFDRFLAAQNADGGWDWSFPDEGAAPAGFSEVGATGLILEALSIGGKPHFREAVEKGTRWLAGVQNADGSWNEVFKDPPTLRGSLNKTCDALNGLNAGKSFGLDNALRAHIEKGVRWIFEQEKLVGDASGWGYEGLLTADVVSTCMVLETLLKIEGVSLPLISANALWLTNIQHCDPSSPEDGKWIGGDSSRTILALADYLAKIRASPLFQVSKSMMTERSWSPKLAPTF